MNKTPIDKAISGLIRDIMLHVEATFENEVQQIAQKNILKRCIYSNMDELVRDLAKVDSVSGESNNNNVKSTQS